jgi:hypothetical protein
LTAGPAYAERNPGKTAFFGQTQVQTSWSFDAYVFGNMVTGPAARVLATLAAKSPDSPAAPSLGDPFMFQDYGDRSADQVACSGRSSRRPCSS